METCQASARISFELRDGVSFWLSTQSEVAFGGCFCIVPRFLILRRQTISMSKNQKRPAYASEQSGAPSRYTFEIKFLKAELPRVIALVLLSVLIWCYAYDRWDAKTWNTPLEYGFEGASSDALGMLAYAKASELGEYLPFGPKTIKGLNAPFEAHWEDSIGVEEFILWLPGLFGRFIGLFAGVNLTVLLAQILAVLGFYAAGRLMGADWRLCAAAGLLFGFARMAFARQLHHLPVTFYWHVPLCLLVCYWIGSGTLGWRSPRFWVAVAIAVVTGWQNPYYTSMFLQLAFFAAAYRFVRGDRATSWSAGAVMAAAIAAFFSTNLDTFYCHFVNGPNPGAVVRNYQWLEYYALKPLDLLMPPPDHRIGALASMGWNYFTNVMVPGETPPSCYLGLVGIAALVWLAKLTLQRATFSPESGLPFETWQVAWIFIYSIIGGANNLAGFFGLQIFRSVNRFSIFILAIVLLFAIRRLSERHKNHTQVWAICGLALLIGLWDQLPSFEVRNKAQMESRTNNEQARQWQNFPPALQHIQTTDAVVESDRTFTRELEKRLPAGSMVFQLPVMDFPESPVAGLAPYEHFRPYLHSEKLRFSFGAIKGRPREQWQHRLVTLPLPEIISRLETFGFGAIYVNRRGLNENGEALLKALAQSGYTEVVESPARDLYAVLLKPSPTPALPRTE